MGFEYTLTSKITSAISRIEEEQKKRATEAGMLAREKVVEKLTGNRTGEMGYTPAGARYTMSAPGEPPASRTGELRGSIAYRVERVRGGYTAVVGSPKDYAPHLEFGTYKMEARPFFRPTLNANRGEFISIMRGRWF